jgi:hypothetical protein
MDESGRTKVSRIKMLAYRELVFWAMVFYPLVLLASVTIVYATFFEQIRRERTRVETSLIGGDIVEALEAYRTRQGEYPESLDGLVPTYLDPVIRPPWGNSGWRYRKYNKDAFELEVGFGSDEYLYPAKSYSSSNGYWHSDS